MAIEITKLTTAYEGWTRLRVAIVRLPDGNTVRREVEDHGAAVGVLPYDPQRKTAILVQQLRAPVFLVAKEEQTLEVIAGLLEEEDPAECARREAREEAALEFNALEHVATVWTMPGISTERMSLYLATCDAASRGGPELVEEGISVIEMELRELAEMARSGRLADLKTLALVQHLMLRRPELFDRT